MNEYLFALGRDPGLSLAEIASYFQTFSMNYKLKWHDNKVAVFDLEEFNPVKMIKRLGGTMKIAELTKDYNYYGTKKKIFFSVGGIDCDASDLIDELKIVFRKDKLKATLRNPKKGDDQLMPSRASNVDIEFILFNKKTYRVVAVFNPKEYKSRDENRPVFEPLAVISLRLAKILINLSQAKVEVLDPFCGTGTIMQEAMIMGLSTVGVDKDISNAQTNLKWLGDKFEKKWKLIKGDSTKLSSLVESVEAVATEPYMGPYWKTIPTIEEAEEVIKKLTKLYSEFLSELRKVLKGKVAIIFPRFRSTKGRVAMDMDAIIKQAGFKIYQPIKGVSIPVPYYEPDSKLERFIYILEPL